jgi:hypothetical protein
VRISTSGAAASANLRNPLDISRQARLVKVRQRIPLDVRRAASADNDPPREVGWFLWPVRAR